MQAFPIVLTRFYVESALTALLLTSVALTAFVPQFPVASAAPAKSSV